MKIEINEEDLQTILSYIHWEKENDKYYIYDSNEHYYKMEITKETYELLYKTYELLYKI